MTLYHKKNYLSSKNLEKARKISSQNAQKNNMFFDASKNTYFTSFGGDLKTNKTKDNIYGNKG